MLGLGLKVRILSPQIQIPPLQNLLSKKLDCYFGKKRSGSIPPEPKGGERGTGSRPQQQAKQEAAKT